MSHFTLLVALPAGTEDINAELDKRLAPFDENMTVEPYRDYEDGAAEEHFFVTSRRAANSTTTMDPDRLDAARLDLERLGDAPASWEKFVEVYNARFYPESALAVPGDTDDQDVEGRFHYDAETGRAYRLITYNPESKWDWWSIGGRWGGYFRMKALTADVLEHKPDWSSPGSEFNPHSIGNGLRSDGGPKGTIDLEAMRAERAEEAHIEYDRWELLSGQHPVAKSWSHFTGLVELGDLTIEQAREQYHAQPLIVATKRDKLISGVFSECPVDRFLPPREEYVKQARDSAVPGYALLDLEGQWIAPGKMGWFGMSSDGPGERAGYWHAVNTYINEKLTDQDFLICLDLHI